MGASYSLGKTCNADFVLCIMNDMTLTRQQGERAFSDMRIIGNKKIANWHSERHSDIQQHIPFISIQAALRHHSVTERETDVKDMTKELL